MFNSLLKRAAKKLREYTLFQKIFATLKRTPTYAVHWYMLMALGILIVVVNVGLAWIAFRSVSVQVNEDFSQTVTATTIQRETLQDVIDTYRARDTELNGLKQKAPYIIDPGR